MTWTCFLSITTAGESLTGEEGHTLCQNPVKSPFVSYCENNNSLVLRLDAARESPAVINHPDGRRAPRPAQQNQVAFEGWLHLPQSYSNHLRYHHRRRNTLPLRFNQITSTASAPVPGLSSEPRSGVCLNTRYVRSLGSILKLICHQSLSQ